MLLSWLDRLTLLIHPHRVVLERQPWRATASRHQADVALPTAAETDWQPALTAADALLRVHGARGGSLRIVVADHFVRYTILPWSENLSSPKARQSMALALLKHTLGDKVHGLEITVDRPEFARSGIAAGIDRRLLAALRTSAKLHRLHLSSLRPRLITELAARKKQLPDGWFACIDRDWLTLAGLRRGEIGCLHSHRANTGNAPMLAGELAGLLIAESAAVDGKKLFISSCEVAAPTLSSDWETVRWPAAVCGEIHA